MGKYKFIFPQRNQKFIMESQKYLILFLNFHILKAHKGLTTMHPEALLKMHFQEA